MTEEEMTIANKTARSNGAVGKNALLPRIIRSKYNAHNIPSKIESGTIDQPFAILDFGSGPKALHTEAFAKDGYPCTAYEMGANFDPEVHADDEALGNSTFDIVMASNVINTLSSLSAIRETLSKIHKYTDSKGLALINLPTSPRKLKGLTKQDVIDMLLIAGFTSITTENHNGTKVFYCYKRSTR